MTYKNKIFINIKIKKVSNNSRYKGSKNNF